MNLLSRRLFKRIRWQRFYQLFTASLIVGILVSVATPSVYAGRGKPAIFDELVLRPVVVESLPLQDAPVRADEEAIEHKLSEEATKQARRLLVRAHLARCVEDGVASPSLIPVVHVTLRLPTSLPLKLRGWDASQHKGRFASVTLLVQDASTGTVLAKGEASCDWKDAFWSINRKSRPVDEVLEHFARKTTERAIWDAARNGFQGSSKESSH